MKDELLLTPPSDAVTVNRDVVFADKDEANDVKIGLLYD
jgi:hypothetical protein